MDRVEQGIALFNRGRFFEAHEVLEDEWRLERGPRRLFLQALIHVAVACYHAERGNTPGALGQLRKALAKLTPYTPEFEGVLTDSLRRDAGSLLERLQAGAAVRPRLRMLRKRAAE